MYAEVHVRAVSLLTRSGGISCRPHPGVRWLARLAVFDQARMLWPQPAMLSRYDLFGITCVADVGQEAGAIPNPN